MIFESAAEATVEAVGLLLPAAPARARQRTFIIRGWKWACQSPEVERSPHRKGPLRHRAGGGGLDIHPLNKASASQSLHLPPQFFWSQSFPNHCSSLAQGLAGSPNPQQGLWGPPSWGSFMRAGLMTAWTNPVHPSSPSPPPGLQPDQTSVHPDLPTPKSQCPPRGNAIIICRITEHLNLPKWGTSSFFLSDRSVFPIPLTNSFSSKNQL